MKGDKKFWSGHHKYYAGTDWINNPNIFAEQVLEYLPEKGSLLDIGAGRGQDSKFFADRGYDVTSLDISAEALQEANDSRIKSIEADITQGLPFKSESFDIVYAHLSLHYFGAAMTDKIFLEINRVLRPNGVLAFFTNSTTDPEYGTGEKIEDDFFAIGSIHKRYFSVESAQNFANKYFEEILVDNNGETYKDAQKGIHNLIRYVGRKRIQK